MLGLLQPAAPQAGRVVVMGDSECTESGTLAKEGTQDTRCWWLLQVGFHCCFHVNISMP